MDDTTQPNVSEGQNIPNDPNEHGVPTEQEPAEPVVPPEPVFVFQTVNGHDITQPRFYYLGRYSWNPTGFDGNPLAELPSQAIGAIDLRSLPDQQYSGNIVSNGWAFFTTAEKLTPSANLLFLGDKIAEALPAETVTLWNSTLNITSTSNNLADLLWDTLTIFSDPTGATAPKSLMPSRGELQLWLGGHSKIKNKTFSIDLPEFVKIKEQLQLGYRELKKQDTGEKTYLKQLSVWEKEYGISYKEFIPKDLPDEKPLKPTTVLKDNFSDTNGTGIASHTPSGGGFSWVVDDSTGTPQIQSNQLSGGGVTGDSVSRAATSLSSANMYVQGVWQSGTGGSGPGWMARKASSSTQTYYMTHMTNTGTTYDRFYKGIAGSFTALGTTAYGISKTLPQTYRFDVSGTTLTLSNGGASVTDGEITDSAIDGTTVGGLQTGVYMGYGSSGTVVVDDFEAGDRNGDWYNASWTKRIRITVDHTKVGAALTDFPVYVNLADLSADFHTNVKAAGADIRITTGDGTTEAPIDLVFYDAATDTGELHFKAPLLSNAYDTDFYIYYGNSGASAPAENATYGAQNVWNSAYKAVYHLHEAVNNTAGGYKDSTSNNNDATGTSMAITAPDGKLAGKSAEFDGSADFISLGAKAINTASVTISAWVNAQGTSPSVANAYLGHPIVADNDGASNARWKGIYRANISSTDRLYAYNWDSNEDRIGNAYTAGTWAYVVQTHNSTTLIGYAAGASSGSTASGTTGGNGNTDYIGGHTQGKFDGAIDEVRISNVVRASTWISTEYNNQNSPSTFYTDGAQESGGGGGGFTPTPMMHMMAQSGGLM